MSKRDSFLIFFVLLGVLLVLGFHPLHDPDLPWHLVGGLWIMEHLAVPRIDPLGAPGAEWLAYSWLAEILIAAFYQLDGFSGLRILQLGFVFFAGGSVFVLFCHLCRKDEELLAAIVAWLISLSLLAPMFHLRPQLISVGFFALFLRLLLVERVSLIGVFLLTVLWANIHVFWVFVPVISGLHFLLRADAKKSLLSVLLFSLAGLISPYGWENIALVFHYAFSHGVAYQLIDEFRPLTIQLGYVFYFFLASLLLLPLFVRRIRGDKDKLLLFLLAILFSLASLLQRKYLPFSGVLSGALLTLLLVPSRPRSEGGEGISVEAAVTRSPVKRSPHTSLFVLSVLLFGATVILFVDRDPALPVEFEELLRISELIPNPVLTENEAVYEGFDQGGWVGLAFYLQDGAMRRKTLIDGRTLVMGEERLSAYSQMVQGKTPPCVLLKLWGASYAIVERTSRVKEGLLQGGGECSGAWTTLSESAHWSVLQAHLPQ